MTLRRLLPAVLLVAAACGDDGGKNNPSPDAPSIDAKVEIDGPDIDAPVGPTCTELVPTTYNFDEGTTSVSWSSVLTTDLGGGGDSLLQFEFYGSGVTGTIDLSAGDNANYATCTACVRAFAVNADGTDVTTQWFQTGGTLTLTADPVDDHKLVGTLTDLTMVEVTIAEDYTSTPVAGGSCTSIASLTLNADDVPAAWTCTHDKYKDGTTCDCMCGDHDPDCDLTAPPVAGCTGTQICGSDDTCISTCDSLSTPPVGCAAGSVCGFQSATQDICYTDPAVVDAALLGAQCATPAAGADPALFCAVNAVNHVSGGLCDLFYGDDETCRKTCDMAADCLPTELCQPVVGAKGLCITKTANDTCQAASTLTIATPVTGSTGGATNQYSDGLDAMACTGFSQDGNDVAYKVTLAAGTAYTVTLDQVSADFDPSISVAGPGTAAAVCDATTITCLKGADAGLKGDGETFTFTPTTAGVYFIIVDSFNTNSGGSFRINVTQ